MSDPDRYERLLAWSHAWQRYALRVTTLGPWSKLPAVERRIAAAMRRCWEYGQGRVLL